MTNKKNSNKTWMSLGIFGVIAILGMSMVFAYQGDYSVNGPNYSEDRHEAMEQAFDNLDYNAWVILMTESGKHSRVVDIVTEDNFAIFAEAHEAGKSGDSEKALELRTELGLNNGIGFKDGTGFGGKKGLKQGQGMKIQHKNLYLE